MINIDNLELKDKYYLVRLIPNDTITKSGILIKEVKNTPRIIDIAKVIKGKTQGQTVVFNKAAAKPFILNSTDDDYFICTDDDIIAYYNS